MHAIEKIRQIRTLLDELEQGIEKNNAAKPHREAVKITLWTDGGFRDDAGYGSYAFEGNYQMMQDFGDALGGDFSKMTSPTLVRKFIKRPACLKLVGGQLHVILDPFGHDTSLSDWIHQINEQQLQIPWLGNLVLQISIAQKPALVSHNSAKIKRRVFAKSAPQKAA